MIVRNVVVLTLALLGLLAVSGCTLETPTPPAKHITNGTDLLLNEFYSISPEKYYSYAWIELYNPTNHNIEFLSHRSLGPDSLELTVIALTMNLEFRIFTGVGEQIIDVDTAYAGITPLGAVSNIVGTVFGLPKAFPSDSVIFPGKFLVVTNDKDRFDSHFRLGPFDPTLIQVPIIGHFDTTRFVGGTARWYPMPYGEVRVERSVYVLKDTTLDFPFPGIKFYVLRSSRTQVVDVIRYGNYHPNPDPTPANKSLDIIQEGWSVARYGGYYKTGNTSDAFYLSDSPIPGWYSQLHK